jgi:sugar phosphate isomerase/epimerase
VRLSFSQISTINASFGQDVPAYAGAGFDAIGLWEFKLPADDAANREQLRAAGLAVANCVPEVPSILPLRVPGMEGPSDVEERIEALCRSVARFAPYEPECVLFLTGPCGEHDPAEARRLSIEGARAIAEAGARAGVPVALEASHASESGASSFLSSLAEAEQLLDEAGLPELGLMADTHHLWDTPTLEDDVQRLGGRIRGLHVADRLAPERGDRVPPTEGVTHPERMVRLVCAQGFDGSLDVEIFSTPDGFWALPVDEAARRAYAGASALRALLAD